MNGKVYAQPEVPREPTAPVSTGVLRRHSTNQPDSLTAPPIVHEVLRSLGQPLDIATRAFMEPRFGHDFSKVQVHSHIPESIQAKLTISQPGDPYEREADRIAEQVVHISASQEVAEESDEEERIQAKMVAAQITPLIQRQPEDEEEEDDEEELVQPSLTCSREPLIQWHPEPGDEDKGTHQAKPTSVRVRPTLPGGREIHRRLSRAETSGGHLPPHVRSSMELAFGATFNAVRIHTNPAADNLSRSLSATAFTHGSHIFFSTGTFDPTSVAGKKLLAHELTHVVQQNPQLRIGRPESPDRTGSVVNQARVDTTGEASRCIQRQESAAPKTTMGILYLFDERGELLAERDITIRRTGIPVGRIYNVQISRQEANVYILELYEAGANEPLVKDKLVIGVDPEAFEQQRKRAAKLLLAVPDPEQEAGETAEPPRQASQIEETPQEGGEKETETGAKPTESPSAGRGTGGKQPTEPLPSQAGPGGKRGGTGKGTRPGSKYGWLGILPLPQEVIDVLEEIFEALGDAEEWQALQQLLTNLEKLANNRAAFRSLIDTDRLLGVMLGIETVQGIDRLEAWVNATPPKPPTKGKPSRSDLLKLARKVMKILEGIRKMLKPVFKARAGFMRVTGAVAMIIEELPLIEDLLEMAADVSKQRTPDFSVILEDFTEAAANAIHDKLVGARASVKLHVEGLAASDLVTYEELARAVLDTVLKAVPKQYKPVVKAAEALGLLNGIADNMIAPLMPKSALNAINDVFKEVIEHLVPIIEVTEELLDIVLDEVEQVLQQYLLIELKDLFVQPSCTPGVGRFSQRSALAALGHLRHSEGEQLPDDLRHEMELGIGADFGHVRIHHDAPAQLANAELKADAFTIGRHIFFEPSKYTIGAPDGRRLLAHELVHVVQQQDGAPPGVIQRNATDTVTKLGKHLAPAVGRVIKPLLRPSRSMRQRAARITAEVNSKFVGKVVDRAPPLPEAYSYVRKGRKIIRIRRRPQWIAAGVPKLAIEARTRKIKISTSDYDPRKAARARLRRALGCGKRQEAHHVIPLSLRNHPVVRVAQKNGWNFNDSDNGICLSKKTHQGDHGKYTRYIQARLAGLQVEFPKLQWNDSVGQKGIKDYFLDKLVLTTKSRLQKLDAAKKGIGEIR